MAEMIAKEIIGTRFGRLTVVKYVPGFKRGSSKVKARCECRCECGGTASPFVSDLRKGHTTSCGCIKNDAISASRTRHGHSTRRTGATKLYRTWRGMLDRCTNPKNKKWDRYGGRGISVCTEWSASFERFAADMGEPPPGRSIDRIDNNLGYSADNCRWATQSEQKRNTSRTRRITLNGETRSLTEWAEIHGISPRTVRSRLRKGLSEQDALSNPVKLVTSGT